MRKEFLIVGFCVVILAGICTFFNPSVWPVLVVLVAVYFLGLYDAFQKRHAILRNFPVIGHFRYFFEMIRPEIQQYFVESYSDGKPFSREQRSVVYQRAKGQEDNTPFGTQIDFYKTGAEWIDHSIVPAPKMSEEPRVLIGNEQCSKPYSASIFNISGMSFGSLSKSAVLALNKGAKLGGFIQDTGEGSLTPYHLEPGGDITWQIATGYFGCRTIDGKFDPEKFRAKATLDNIKMIELKLSQGAKPGHGGILPAPKVSKEIAEIRGVPQGVDCISPQRHSAFTTPLEMMNFLQRLRELSGGKPVGFKLCIGKRREFLAICKAMIESKIYPDFITIDGAEGGTGAAPLEFANGVGTPLREGLTFVNNALVGCGLRGKIKLIVAGKVITGFDIASKLAMGADLCNSARGMMFAIGCIQALRCNTNSCPTGVATQDPELMVGLNVADKAQRVANYHRATVKSFIDILAAAGLEKPQDLRPWHIQRRISETQVCHYNQIYEYLEPGALLGAKIPESYYYDWNNATAASF
jgi:glutamate synthase domain-containing protein 2